MLKQKENILFPLPFRSPGTIKENPSTPTADRQKSVVVVTVVCVLVAFLCLPGITACNRDNDWLTDTSARLKFSEDTVKFDTVFTTMGSTVHVVKVYNPYDRPLLLDEVTMKNGSASRFRLNVDGDTGRVARDVQLAAHDSLFIFVRANINPNSTTEPFLIEDAIIFSFNGKEQELPTTAFGRNAVYHLPDHSLTVAGNTLKYSIIHVSQWDHTKPHIIFGYAVVDEDSVLNLTAGDELYFANGASLWVYDGGSLRVHGDATRPVLFTGIRHDYQYRQLPDQWLYVWLSGGSRNNSIDWAVIENANCGLRVDTCVNQNPTLTISNTIIRNHTLAGIVGQGAVIQGDNLLVYNCGAATLLLQAGGTYHFVNSTFADFWSYSGNNRRTTPSVILTNYHESNSVIYPRNLSVTLQNCIVWGNHYLNNKREELQINQTDGATMALDFDHCLLATQLLDSISHPGKALLINYDPAFVDIGNNDYRLLEKSPAIGAGSTTFLLHSYDLNNHARLNPPAIGCYEYADTAATATIRRNKNRHRG